MDPFNPFSGGVLGSSMEQVLSLQTYSTGDVFADAGSNTTDCKNTTDCINTTYCHDTGVCHDTGTCQNVGMEKSPSIPI